MVSIEASNTMNGSEKQKICSEKDERERKEKNREICFSANSVDAIANKISMDFGLERARG